MRSEPLLFLLLLNNLAVVLRIGQIAGRMQYMSIVENIKLICTHRTAKNSKIPALLPGTNQCDIFRQYKYLLETPILQIVLGANKPKGLNRIGKIDKCHLILTTLTIFNIFRTWSF